MTTRRFFIGLFIFFILGLVIYYFDPTKKIPNNITIDKIRVLKSEHLLQAYAKEKLIVSYKISIGRNPVGGKEFEGDQKTPEGLYYVDSKNPKSDFHKNLGISYPSQQNIENAKRLGKPAGGDIKIHGLKNGQEYLGKFQRWKDWTDGCIALTNEEIDELYDHTRVGTPIEIKK